MIEVKSIFKKLAVLPVVLLALSMVLSACQNGSGCSGVGRRATPQGVGRSAVRSRAAQTEDESDASIAPSPTAEQEPWNDEELYNLALTLSGECYEDKVDDKRLVCEVILNRVSDGRFGGDTVLEVVSADSPAVQFEGYWKQARPISENDVSVAEQALQDWYANDCQPLSDYLYFQAGENRENTFS